MESIRASTPKKKQILTTLTISLLLSLAGPKLLLNRAAAHVNHVYLLLCLDLIHFNHASIPTFSQVLTRKRDLTASVYQTCLLPLEYVQG
jgi:hypothetical protein